MEITGKIILSLPEQGGTSKAGNAWRKKEYVLETHDQYPKQVHFDFFGDRINQYPLEVGQEITLSFDIESREYNGRWYTSIRGWKAEPATAAQSNPVAQMGQPAYAAPMAPQTSQIPPVVNNTEDLPF